MTRGTYIKITKLTAVDNPAAPTPDWKDYKVGQLNKDVSLPVDYTAEGYLVAPINVGQVICIERTKRNDVVTPGQLTTTPLVSWDGKTAKTQNSVYLVEEIPVN